MEQITIQVKNKRKAHALIEFLKAMDLVEAVNSGFTIPRPKSQVDEDDFFALKGLWAGRDISLESIRQKAWP
jgi:rRNA processing protein Krr1/Pno1